jgi:phosphoribosylformimino-5-aminoimidazole carboxamide ribotide isomerase
MSHFHLYPAIDLRRGRCVRLQNGEAEHETVYGADPVAVAARFAADGARWVHVVDLDAAFAEGSNRHLIEEIAALDGIRIQTGGGLRSEADVAAVLGAGIARAVIGTAAVEDPELVRRCVSMWGADRIAVGLDARGRRPALRGWREEAGTDLFDLAAALVEQGVRTLIYTDIERDGMLSGPNVEMGSELGRQTGAEVILSGGVGSADDIAAAAAETAIAGVVLGKAIYEGRVDLATVLRLERG